MVKVELLIALSLFIISGLPRQVVSTLSWVDHLNQCKDAKCIQQAEMTVEACKKTCAAMETCEMVKYYKEKMKCFLCQNQELKASPKCAVKYDFYVKVFPSVEWTEYLGLCRNPTVYKTVSAKTTVDCKEVCAKDARCAMVKYFLQKKRCWLCKSSEMRPSEKCPAKYDFFVKALPVPHVDWTEHLGICKDPSSYKTLWSETAIECKNTCARDRQCPMVKYNTESKKCWLCLSTEMRASKSCSVKDDFYVKVIPVPDVEWVEHLGVCRRPLSYATVEAESALECKNTCARDVQCAMVKYHSKKEKCWLCETKDLPASITCPTNYDFYEKVLPAPNLNWIEYLGMCKLVTSYASVAAETALECKNTCARDQSCAMVKYQLEKKKCWLCKSTEMRFTKSCFENYDFYKKVSPVPVVTWIDHLGICRIPSSYSTMLADTALDCKDICTKDKHCAMVKYQAGKMKCSLCKSLGLRYSKSCPNNYDFYQKDACASSGELCKENLFCLNNGHSHECLDNCGTGYHTAEGNVCKDIDECVQNKDLCGGHGNCFNTLGSYTCICNDGYQEHGGTCKDIDECSKTQSLCGEDGKCVNIPGTYTCSCRHGYKLHRKRCQDINECVESSNVCSPNAACQNTDGGYQCNCLIGYQGDGKTCKDVDECSESTYVCKPFAKCVNTIGSYGCACKAGYHGDGYVCNDIDECTKGSHACEHHCTNTAGSYKCSCKHGYHAKGSTCKDINECTNSLNLCGLKASCVNQPGSYRCVCKRGFTLLEEKCIDVDECSEWKDICRQHFKCVNNIGSYKCVCKHGFRLEGKHCKDINECAKSDEVCGQNTECINKIGSYECLCKLGFQRNGTLCEDIDECTQPYHCEEHEKCVNTIGSFECKCDQGFYRSGKRCKAGDPSEASMTTTSIPAATDVPEISTRLSNENEATTHEKLSTVFTEQLPTMQSTEHLTMSVTEQPTMSPTKQPTTSITEESTSMQNEATTNEKPSTVFTEQLPTMQSTEHLTMSVTEQPTMSPTKQPTTSITEESTNMLKGASTTEPSTMSATEQRTSTFTDVPTKGFTEHPTTTPFTEQQSATDVPEISTKLSNENEATTNEKPSMVFTEQLPTMQSTEHLTMSVTEQPTMSPTKQPTTSITEESTSMLKGVSTTEPSTMSAKEQRTSTFTDVPTKGFTEYPTTTPFTEQQSATDVPEKSTRLSNENEATTNEKPSMVFTEQLPTMQSTEHLTMSVTEQPTMSPTKQPTTSITEESTSMLKSVSTTEPSTMSATEQRTSTFTDVPTKGFTEYPTTTPFTEQPTTIPPTDEDFIEETTMPTRNMTNANMSSANMTSTDMTTAPAVSSTISPTTEEWFPTDLDIGIIEEVVPSVEWIAHHSLCMSVSSYEVINGVSSATDCKRRCEEQTKCVIVQYDKEGSKCWLCHNRKMTRSGKCKNRYDYYIKGIDECNGERQCHHRHAVCKKAGGHKLCECIYGFQGDGFDCKDIDECSAYQHVCSANARCLNSIGSYSCKCNRGYVQNRRTCTRRKTSSPSQRKKHTATELQEVIRTWKEEHSGAISSYVVTIRTFCFGLLLPQVLYHFLVK